ncbi:MAG: tetratricopeptide repeat protein [Planctomycetota bacterium]
MRHLEKSTRGGTATACSDGDRGPTRKRPNALSCALLATLAACTGVTAPDPNQRLVGEARASLAEFSGLGVRVVPANFALPEHPTPPVDALSTRDVSVRDVLRALFRDSDVSLVIDPTVQGRGTFDLKQVRAEEVLQSVLDAFDLAYRWDGQVLRILPTERRVFDVDLPARDPTEAAATVGAAGAEGAGAAGAGAGAGGANGAGGGGGAGGANIISSALWMSIDNDLNRLQQQNSQTAGTSLLVNPTLGSVLAEGPPSFVARVDAYLDAVRRRASRQVSIEARILEVQLNDEFRAGVDFSLLPGFFNSSNAGNHAGTLAGGGVLAGNNAVGTDALQFGFLNANQFSIFLDALDLQGEVRVISHPRVSTLNNVPAVIRVVQQVPVIEREIIDAQGTARTQFSVRFEDAGVAMNVTPQIGEDGIITCVIQPIITEVTGFITTPDNLVQEPILETRTVTTTLRVADGQPVVLGGLRSRATSETLNKIPLLGDIPWLGMLFRSTVQTSSETELVIMLLPRLLTPDWMREDVERGLDRLIQLRRPYRPAPRSLEEPEQAWRDPLLADPAGTGTPRELPAPRDVEPVDAPVNRSTIANLAFRRATHAADHGDTRHALAELETALDLNPRLVPAWLLQGILLEHRGDLGQARKSYREATTLAPHDPLPRANLGLLEVRAGNDLAGEAHLQASLVMGEHPAVLNNLGVALLSQGRRDEAALQFQRAVDLDPGLPEPYANLATCLALQGHPIAAQASYRSFLLAGGDPRDPRLRGLADQLQTLAAASDDAATRPAQAQIARPAQAP